MCNKACECSVLGKILGGVHVQLEVVYFEILNVCDDFRTCDIYGPPLIVG